MAGSESIRRTFEEIKAEILQCKRMAGECQDEGYPDLARQWSARADVLEWVIGAGRYKMMETKARQKAEPHDQRSDHPA